MEPYIFGQRNGLHIVNLEETTKNLEEVLGAVKELAKKDGVILFVGTKRQAQPVIKKYAKECGMPYVAERWLGGTLTNFAVISKVLKKYKNLKRKEEKGELEKYTKKEQLNFKREIEKMDHEVGGIQDLKKLPDALFILDIKKERSALREAKKKKVKIIGICDTNANPKGIDYIIPANDDATKSIEMMVRLVSEAISEGRKEAGLSDKGDEKKPAGQKEEEKK